MENKKKFERDYEVIEDKTIIKEIEVVSEVSKSFIAYAMAVNVSRAIPDVRDGLKPVHRRILYAMDGLGLSNEKPYRKCARIVGEVLGKYHPHGDSAVYDALVRLAQDFSIRCPLVDGHGNFGSVDGDPAAAQRYTEARLSKISAEMLRDLDKKTVDFYPNFDDTEIQPVVLPSRYPNLLVNGSDGIAVGMATSIPPHNLGEVIDATIAVIRNPEIEIEDIVKIIPAPDFPTGARVLGRSAIRSAYMTGRGGCIIRAYTDIEDFGNNRQRIVVHELPYQVNKSKLIETIADMVKSKRIEGISDVRDESDRKGMRIVVDVKKDSNAQVVLNTLFKHTNLQISFSMIFLALKDGTPRILNIKQILESYIEHQREVIRRRTAFDLNKAEERDHILIGLVIALTNIDEVIQVIKASDGKQDAQMNLMSRFELSDKQANAILEMRLQRITHMEVSKVIEERAEIERAIAEYHEILANPSKVDDIIVEEMTEIKTKYDSPRRSELTYDYGELNIGDLIEREDVIISKTHLGYIKRMSLSEYRSQRRGGVGVTAHKTKEEDFVEDVFVANTHEKLLFFTNKGKVYSLITYEIPEASRTSKGRAMVNLLQLDSDEKVSTILPISENLPEEGNLLLATKHGKIKKTDLSEFESIKRNGKIAIKLLDGDELIAARLTTGNDDIFMAASSGKCIRFNEKNVRQQGRSTMGVKSINIGENDYVVDMSVVTDGDEVMTITEHGYGKRTSMDEYRVQGRAGQGLKAGVFNDKTGALMCMKLVSHDLDLMLITDNGVIIRVPIEEISKQGRATQGVRIMRLKAGKVISVAVSPHYEEEEELEENASTEATSTGEATTQVTDTNATDANPDNKPNDDSTNE